MIEAFLQGEGEKGSDKKREMKTHLPLYKNTLKYNYPKATRLKLVTFTSPADFR